MTLEAIILAGGLGTRLAHVLDGRPKALANIAGRPFLAWQLDYLLACGIGRVVISTGFGGDAIADAFGHAYRGIEVDYVRESVPLGTGGAIRGALAAVAGRGAFVVNGDTLVELDTRRLAGAEDEPLVLEAVEVQDASRFGTLEIAGGRAQRFVEKGHRGAGLVNAGAYWVTPRLFDEFRGPERFSFELDFLHAYALQRHPRVVVVAGPLIDIGVPGALTEAQHRVPRFVADSIERHARSTEERS